MQIIRFLAGDVPVALHAGELWLGLVPPADLAFHIRQAIEIAGARRIGHGVSIAFERAVAGAQSPLENAVALINAALTLPPEDDAPGNRLPVPPAAPARPAAGWR